MGRVYNALVKADKWRGRGRPIGRPADRPERPASLKPDMTPAPRTPGMGYRERAEPVRESAAAAVAVNDAAGANERAASSVTPFPQAVPAPPTVEKQPPAFIEPRKSLDVSNLDVEPHLVSIAGGDALASERYRTLAVRLLNMAARRKLKTLLFTSAQEGEGKTTVATNLAWVMAKSSERRVLLIDADLRLPSVARALEINPGRGWLELLDGSAELIDTAIRLDPNGLYVLAPFAADKDYKENERYGSDQDATAYALTSSRLEKLLKDLEGQFDFILIDAPPILEFADAQRLASIADGTVIVARAGHTHHDQVTGALKLVPKDRRIGVVLNEAQVEEEIAYYNRKKRAGFGRLFQRRK